MKFSNKLIGRFRATYKRKFGRNISEELAERDLSVLANLVKIITKSKFKED